MDEKTESQPAGGESNPEKKVINLAVYKIRRSLREEGFDLLADETGKLTLAMRRPES